MKTSPQNLLAILLAKRDAEVRNRKLEEQLRVLKAEIKRMKAKRS